MSTTPTTSTTRRAGRVNLVWAVMLALVIEAVTCLFRFGLHLQSTRDTGFIRHLTFGVRIHHGYIGLLLVAAAVCLSIRSRWRGWLIRVGLALVLSDLAHHFLVLWPITGDPHFDLVYPDDQR